MIELPFVAVSPTLFVAGTAAALALGVAKGGFGGIGTIVAVPLVSLAAEPERALAILLPLLLLADAISVTSHRRAFDRRAVLQCVPGAAAGVAVGGLLLAVVNGAWITVLIGALSVGFAVQSFAGAGRPDGPTAAGDPRLAVPFGVASGLTSTLAHAGGPPIHVHFLSRGYAPVVFVATSAVFMACVNLMKLVPYVWVGSFDASSLGVSALLVPAAALGSFAGVALARRISRRAFSLAVNAAMLLIGLRLLWTGAKALQG